MDTGEWELVDKASAVKETLSSSSWLDESGSPLYSLVTKEGEFVGTAAVLSCQIKFGFMAWKITLIRTCGGKVLVSF